MTNQKVTDVNIEDIVQRWDLDPRPIRLSGPSRQNIIGMQHNLHNLPPITITTKYVLVDGAHRLIAHRWAGETTIKAIVIEHIEDDYLLRQRMFLANIDNGTAYDEHELKRFAEAMYEHGETKKHIAETVRVTIRTVYRWFKEADAEKRRLLKKSVFAMHEAGLNNKQVADELGITRKRVAHLLKRQEEQPTEQPPPPRAPGYRKDKQTALREYLEKFHGTTFVPQESVQMTTLANKNRAYHAMLADMLKDLTFAVMTGNFAEERRISAAIGLLSEDWESDADEAKTFFVDRSKQQE